jgi:hypothetical protein
MRQLLHAKMGSFACPRLVHVGGLESTETQICVLASYLIDEEICTSLHLDFSQPAYGASSGIVHKFLEEMHLKYYSG